MEAATPLHHSHVRTIGDRIVIDGLSLADDTVVRLVRAREEAGEDAVGAVVDAIEIGARVLDREQTGANAEFVRTEFEKVSGEVQRAFGDQAKGAAEALSSQLEQVFGPDNGHLAKALERHFSDDSSGAVQHRVREMVAEVLVRSREDLLKQFSADDGHNPLADFKRGTAAIVKQASERQDSALRAVGERMAELQRELQALRDEKDKQSELAAAHDNSAHKGRPFEEAAFDALDALAAAQGDDCDDVGDTKGSTRRTGDIVVALDACNGPARGRVVFEAKNRRLSKPEALRELDRGMAERDADYAVLVVATEEQVPARTQALREYDGDKLFVVFDPAEPRPLALELAYRLARARVLMQRGGADGIDAAAVRDTVERALAAMEDVRKVKSQLTGATTSIDNARGILEAMADRVRLLLGEIESLTAAADGAGSHVDA